MKRLLLPMLVVLIGSAAARAALSPFTFESNFANEGVIPDNDWNGWQDTRIVTGIPTDWWILSLVVTLEVSGGWNGDLYGYLAHDTGLVVLLNRVGRTATDGSGYGNTGFNVVFADTPGNADIHLYQDFSPTYTSAGRLLGTWQTDGRNVHPSGALDTDARTTSLAAFKLLDPNGEWRLYLADVSPGDQSTIVRWELQIEAVPEASTLVPVLLVLGWAVCLHRRTRRLG